MKVGYLNKPRMDLKDEIRWIGENGFDFIDLFLEPDKCSLDQINRYRTKEQIKNYKLGIIGHTAWYLPIGSPMKELRDSAVEILKRYFEAFSEMECTKVTVHANWAPSMFSEYEAVMFQTESLQKLVSYGREVGVQVMYEPVDSQFDCYHNIDKILELNPGVLLHADIGHFNLCGRKPAEYLAKYKNRIAHIHMHDNNGYGDQHLPMGAGNIDWHAVISTLKSFYDSTITLEIFTSDRNCILQAKDNLKSRWYQK